MNAGLLKQVSDTATDQVVQQIIKQAIAIERERCAKIAEDFDDFVYSDGAVGYDMVKQGASMKVLAEQIRKGE